MYLCHFFFIECPHQASKVIRHVYVCQEYQFCFCFYDLLITFSNCSDSLAYFVLNFYCGSLRIWLMPSVERGHQIRKFFLLVNSACYAQKTLQYKHNIRTLSGRGSIVFLFLRLLQMNLIIVDNVRVLLKSRG